MGWTFTEKPRSQSVREFFEERFNCTNEHGSWKILDCASTFTEAYLAVERTLPSGETYVFAMICLIKRVPSDPNYNFGYKDMDESMGPCYYNCPKRILDLLTPTDNEYANRWRDECRTRLNKPKLVKGLVIEFDRPLNFGSFTETRFIVVSGHPKVRCRAGNATGPLCRIQRPVLQDYEWHVADQGDSIATRSPQATGDSSYQPGLF